MSAPGTPSSPTRRWTVLAALLGVVSLAAGAVVSFDFEGAPQSDEVRMPLAVLACLAWVCGLAVARTAACRARRFGERAMWPLGVAAVLVAVAVMVVVAIWAIASAGLS